MLGLTLDAAMFCSCFRNSRLASVLLRSPRISCSLASICFLSSRSSWPILIQKKTQIFRLQMHEARSLISHQIIQLPQLWPLVLLCVISHLLLYRKTIYTYLYWMMSDNATQIAYQEFSLNKYLFVMKMSNPKSTELF